jgi:anaerobic selenocysteine-containing dehydrogenase
VSELAGRSDYDLEAAGRLSEAMSYDAASGRYVPISSEEAFELVGSALRGLESPHWMSSPTQTTQTVVFFYIPRVRATAATDSVTRQYVTDPRP